MKSEVFALGIIPENIVYRGGTCRLTDTCTLQAKCLIALYCKKVKRTSFVQWINNMSSLDEKKKMWLTTGTKDYCFTGIQERNRRHLPY